MPLLTPTAGSSRRFESDYYVEGYATTFDDPYVLYEYDGVQYQEVVDRHALDGADLSDVIMQYDHGGRVFARTGKSDTLIVEPQARGLFMAADLSKTEQARSMHEDIADQDVLGLHGPGGQLRPGHPHPAYSQDQEGVRRVGCELPGQSVHRYFRPFLA